jgi:pimeloyl-ACP methyl ester carboxylesterase
MAGVTARAALAIAACGAVAAAAGAERPQLSVTPESGLMDAPFHVVIQHVLPGSRVRVSAQRPDVHGRSWTAVGVYLADASGRVDLDVDPSLGGSYQGVSPHGLWCSALPVAPEQLEAYVAQLPKHPELGTAPSLDTGALYTATLTASIDGNTVATATATRSYAANIVPEEVTAAGGVRGLFYPPPAQVPQKVPVVVLAGSGGGLPQTQAALLASHGHPALAQGIFAYKDLPPTLRGIPLESFRAAAHWLEQRTGAHRVAVMGTSRGSEAAGLAASYFPQDFAAAVVLVPSHLSNGAFGPGITEVEPAWTYAGKPVPADRGETDSNNAGDAAHSNEPPGFVGTPYYLKTWSDPSISRTFGIPFERMHGPVLAIGGGADEMWPSFIGAEQIRRRLVDHGKSDQVEMHVYPGAGHFVSRVGSGGPLSAYFFHPVAKDFEATGGLPNANCEGSYDAWQNVVLFLAKVKPR